MPNNLPSHNRRHLDPAHHSPLYPDGISPTQVTSPIEEFFLPTINLPTDPPQHDQTHLHNKNNAEPEASSIPITSPGLESGRTTPTLNHPHPGSRSRLGLKDRRMNSFENMSRDLPLDYLECYPFPAFVLFLPIPPTQGERERDGSGGSGMGLGSGPGSGSGLSMGMGVNTLADIQFTRNAWLGSSSSLNTNSPSISTSATGAPTGSGAIPGSRSGSGSGSQAQTQAGNKNQFEPVWSNSRYRTLANGHDFLDLLDTRQMVRFADWTSGVVDFESRKEKIRAGSMSGMREREREMRMRRSGSGSGSGSGSETEVTGDRAGNGSAKSGSRLRRGFGQYDNRARKETNDTPVDLDAGIDELSKLDPGSDEEERVDTELSSPDEADDDDDDDEDDTPGEVDLLEGIREHVERDREACSSGRSDDSDPVEDARGDTALDIVFRVPSSNSSGGRVKKIGFTLTKTSMPTTPRSKVASLVVIQAVPLSGSALVDGEIVSARSGTRRMGPRSSSTRYGNTSSTTTLQNAHRSSFPFYAQNEDEDGETPQISDSRWKRTRSRTASNDWSDGDVDEDETPDQEGKSEVSGLFPPSEPVILGAPDLDQLSSGPRKPMSDKTSVEYLLQTTDWSKTSLGPREQWSQSLRTMLSLVQALPLQATLWWGPDLVLLYNEHYATMLQGKHPRAFGMEGAKGYAEVWSALGPVAKTVMSGVPASQDDDMFLFETNDPEVPLVEYYHSWYWTPIFDTDFRRGTNKHDPRKFLGLFNFTRNTTRKVIAERRLRAMREVSDNLQAARNIEEYNSAILSALGSEEISKDVPFAILYHVNRDGDGNEMAQATSITEDDRSTQGSRQAQWRLKLKLGGSLGVPKGHRAVADEYLINIKKPHHKFGGLDPARTSSPTLSMISNLSAGGEDDENNSAKAERWPFKETLQGRKAVVVDDVTELIEGFQVRSWDGLPRKAILLPICNDSSAEIPSGILIVGVNLRRKYDQDYIEWHHQLRLSAYSGLLQVRSVEAEIQRVEELRQIDEIKNNWISNVSHELRLPLTLISGPVDDMMNECQGNTRIKNLLTITKRNVGRLRRLVDQLMDFSRIEGGRYAIACRPMPIGSLTRDLANLFRGAIERSKLEYNVECEEDHARRCWVDPDMYEKIALNLIGNAFKYCHQGGVTVSLKYTDHFVVLQVSDTGVGIPRNQMHRIGERFFRVKTHSRSHEGTGIGLSLTKELIRLQGGSLELESWVAEEQPDGRHGSQFTVKLPLGFSHLPASAIEEGVPQEGPNRNRTFAEGMVDEALQWNRDSESSQENSSDSGASTRQASTDRSAASLDPNTLFFDKTDVILVVDDSKDLRTYLTSILKPYVGQVIEASDGVIGLAKAKQYKPALIISDIQMPNLDGFGLLQAVKSSDELRWTPVILLTARAGEGERVEGLLTGAEDYMTKPFQSRELVARVSLQVQLGKRRRILEEAFATRLDEVEKRREAAELERKRQELLIDVTSHELRNPTSAIIQCSQMIGEDIASLRETVQQAMIAGQSIAATEELVKQLAANEELCQNINSCGQSQSRIADDVLALARINLDMMQFTYQSTNIRTRAKEVVTPFALEAKAKGIELVLDVGDKSLDPVPNVMTDPFRLGQVLVNLVSNAMRYSGEGPVKRVIISFAMRPEPPSDTTCKPPAVEFPAKIEDGDHLYLYVSVTDSGPGLAAEDVQILFRRFSQATNYTNKAFGGSGLGLWISKQISTQMGGKIEVDSEFGKGCTFRFYVRVLAAERHSVQPQLVSNLQSDSPISTPKFATKPKDLSKAAQACRVLVVEDNMINQTILVKQLKKRGVVVEAVSHGQAAVDRLRQVCSTSIMPTNDKDKPFDVVLMDLEMPVMDGLTAIKLIRSEEVAGILRRSYVIALTGNARQQQIDDALACGMDSVLIKPYKIDEVMARINERVATVRGTGP